MKRLENIKRTLDILLAALTAIALFACSNDNSISSAEDVDYSPVKALQKAPVDITPYGTGSISTTFNLSVINVPTGSTATSPLSGTTSIPAVPNSGIVTSTEICPGSLYGNGVFILQSITVRCGDKVIILTDSCAVFDNLQFPTTCYASFTGKCISGPCTKTLNLRITFFYQY